MIEEIKETLKRLSACLERLIRIGIVTQVYPERGTVRVKFDDLDGVVSYELPVVVRKTYKDKDYWMPDVGEQVLCLFLPYGVEQGFVIGSFYSKADTVPVSDQNVRRINFSDGTIVEYDRAKKKFTVDTPGDVEVKAKNITAVAQETLNAQAKEAKVSAQNAEIQAQSATLLGVSKVEITSPEVSITGMLKVSGMILGGSITSQGTFQAPGIIAEEGILEINEDLQVNGNLTVSGSVTCSSCNQAP